MGDITSLARHLGTLSGEQLELRCLRADDVSEDYVRWLNDEEVNRYLESRFTTHSLASVRDFVQSVFDSDTEILWAMRFRSDDRHIGNIKLGPVDFRYRHAAIGLMIGDKDYWGRGLAADAIAAVTSFAFDVLELNRVEAGCYSANIGSRKAFEKCGYRLEGTKRQAALVDGAWEDVIQLGRLAGDR